MSAAPHPHAGVSRLIQWRNDPESFVVECLGATPDRWQTRVLRALPTTQRVAMQACKGPGKTATLAWTIWWYLLTRKNAKVLVTSISADNLSDCLWSELALWQSKSALLTKMFNWGKRRIACNEAPATWFAVARAWPKQADATQQATTLAGYHQDDMLFVADEVGGIPDMVMSAAKPVLATDLSGHRCKLVIAGNPTKCEGPLWRAATVEKDSWFRQEITADPDDPDRTPRVSAEFARDQIREYGRESPWVKVNIFGQFPPSSIDTLIGLEEVQAAMRRHVTEDAYVNAQRRMGVDVARYGDDRTVIAFRQGLMAHPPVEMRNAGSIEVASRVMAEKSRFSSELELVDGTGGHGSGVVDHMRAIGGSPIEVMFNGTPMDKRYYNVRAEMYFAMVEWIRRGGSLPNRPGLAREISAPTYTHMNDRLILEPKKEIKKRLQLSPDEADAYALTFAAPEQQSMGVMTHVYAHGAAASALHEYDPFSRKNILGEE